MTVATDVPAVAPVMETEAGLKATVGGLVAPEGPLTAAVRATLPVNPLAGVTVTVEVFPVVAPATRLRVVGLALSVKVGTGAAATVTVTVAI